MKIVEAVTIALAVAVGAGLAGLMVAYHSYSIPSGSMSPTVVAGDYVFASNLAYAFGHLPQRGDIVVFKPPLKPSIFMKRVVGIPGDRIQLKDGVLYLNGEPLKRDPQGAGTEVGPFGLSHPVARFRETLPSGKSYTTYSYGPDGDAENTGVYAVPSNQYFVLGDNRDNSVDSRFPAEVGGGYVPLENFRGRADLVISWNGSKGHGRHLDVHTLK